MDERDVIAHNRSVQDDKICCGIFELMELSWMKLEDGSKCMPYILGDGVGNDIRYRVNNCPSCGAYVREVILKSYKKESE